MRIIVCLFIFGTSINVLAVNCDEVARKIVSTNGYTWGKCPEVDKFGVKYHCVYDSNKENGIPMVQIKPNIEDASLEEAPRDYSQKFVTVTSKSQKIGDKVEWLITVDHYSNGAKYLYKFESKNGQCNFEKAINGSSADNLGKKKNGEWLTINYCKGAASRTQSSHVSSEDDMCEPIDQLYYPSSTHVEKVTVPVNAKSSAK